MTKSGTKLAELASSQLGHVSEEDLLNAMGTNEGTSMGAPLVMPPEMLESMQLNDRVQIHVDSEEEEEEEEELVVELAPALEEEELEDEESEEGDCESEAVDEIAYMEYRRGRV